MTDDTSDERVLVLPAREIPAPRTLSPQARAALSVRTPLPPDPPPATDAEAWRARIDFGNQMLAAMYGPAAAKVRAEIDELDAGGVTVYAITPPGAPENRAYLDIHGGSLIMGTGECCRAMGTITAGRVGVLTYAVDYRTPPDHPYPAPLDDCMGAYRWLLGRMEPEQIVVGGASAGGNLAAATVLRARDEGLPLPAGIVLLTPELDLTESGDSFSTNLGLDTVLHRSQATAIALYAGGHDLEHPYLSPLFADLATGFPPAFLQAGTRDLFLSNAVLMHRALRRAGIQAELHVFEGMPHGGFRATGIEDVPEDADLDEELRRFVEARWRG